MKKFLVILLFSLVLIGVGLSKQEVDAISINFDYGNLSPRFQYLADDTGTLIPFEFEVLDDFDTPEDVENIEIVLEQVTYNGGFIKRLQVFETDYYLINSSIIMQTTSPFIAGDDYTIEEYLYMGDIEYLSVLGVYVNLVLVTTSSWNFDISGEYIILDPAVSTIGDSITVDYRYEQSDDYESYLFYDWSNIQWQFEDVIFYRVRYNEMILFTGAVMNTPKVVLTYDTYKVEYGEFLVQDDGVPDFTEQDDYTILLAYDDFWILHYRIDSAMVLPDYRTIHITDIESNTLYESFTTNNILSLQMGEGNNFLNSFIVIPLTDEIGEGLITGVVSMDVRYDPFLKNYEEGSYFIAMVDQHTSNSLLDDASVVWNILDDKDPFELILMKDEIAIDDLQRIIFNKESELISSAYTTTLAKDYALAVSYVDEINASDYTYAISYYLDETIVEDDCVAVGWTLEPVFVPYSLTASDYAITLSEEYCAIGETDIAGHINNSLIYYALDDELGGIIFSIFVLLLINGILIFATRETFIYAIVNIVIILVLSFMGLVPMWFILAVFILGILGLKRALSGGRSYE